MQHASDISSRRGDGAGTRAQLLETAGQVFAEQGFDRATGKEITERAGTNSASINYYFGGFDNLYAEVLAEAHRRVASLDEMVTIAESDISPEEKLRQLIRVGVTALLREPNGWALGVLSREFLAPTPARKVIESKEILPKRALLAQIVADVLGRQQDDPVVIRCTFNVLAPLTLLFVCAPESAATSFPGCCGPDMDPDTLTEHLHAFALGGLRAVRDASS
jgi:TetR/AcrR family transcriptional regulator, regulator of cefoperazone and chloramphenicol sensitivity